VDATLTGVGITQAINLPFVSVDDLRGLGLETDGSDLLTVKNPLRVEESKLRPTLLPGLLNDLRYNQSHGTSSVALFEYGRVFTAEPDPEDPRLPYEYDRLAWAIVGDVGLATLTGGRRQADGEVSLALWRHLAAALGIEADLEASAHPAFHPGRVAEVRIGERAIGHVGELSPATTRFFGVEGRVAVAEVDLDPLLEPTPPVLSTTPSTFPHVDFDLSFLVAEETTAADVVRVTSNATDGLLESADVFDVFTGGNVDPGQKAMAIRYRLRAPDRTLEQKEIGTIRQAMIDAAAEIGATLRGA
jgi:phenylalanyl-tRNA synthetase beta chain